MIASAGGTVPFSYEGRPYLRKIYDSPSKRTLLKCGRQVEKSTSLGNRMLAYACIVPNFKVLYVSPSQSQTVDFSKERIGDTIAVSPRVAAYTTTKMSHSIYHKKFVNHSQIKFRFAFLSAARIRGIPADFVAIDEVQDVLTENIPVIEQCASHSEYKIFSYSGTPLTMDNTLEHYWMNFSTQNEWVVPCERHGTNRPGTWHWNILGEKCIGRYGPICDACGSPIDVSHPRAQWASLQKPDPEDPSDPIVFEGFRIPQIMVPWKLSDEGWREVLIDQRRFGRKQFFNEVLGMSYDSGDRPVTRAHVKNCCDQSGQIVHSRLEEFAKLSHRQPVYAGLDWGCHDDQTRILTKARGWQHFHQLLEADEVAQWDPGTREMSFVRPKVVTRRDWDGDLLHFEAQGLDMMLTPSHTMRVRCQSAMNWSAETAEETAERGGNVKFVGWVDWAGEHRETFVLPGLPKSPGYSGSEDHEFWMEDWLEFLGYYLSEGGLCLTEEGGEIAPYCIKMSQRELANPLDAEKIKSCMLRGDIPFQEYPNPKTSDLNWTICGKQYWAWFWRNVGLRGHLKRIPREFLSLPAHQLGILFDAMMLGDGTPDSRENCHNGAYYSTSKGLCEDFQELCIRLGLRAKVALHKPAEGNRKTRWRTLWSRGRDFCYNTPSRRVERVPYKGSVYCASVPTGHIVTERNGCVAFQGNTGENSFTVMCLGTYIGSKFVAFHFHRFTGRELELPVQIDRITQIMVQFGVQILGCDYGGGFDRNEALIRRFGPEKVFKYQYTGQLKGVIRMDPKLGRFMVHRTEVMSAIFGAIRNQQVAFPAWNEFQDPFGNDILNIYSEYSERLRMIQYDHAHGCTDDSFHAFLYCMLASMVQHPRPDLLAPKKEGRK